MADWLSSKITVRSVGGPAENSAQSFLIHTASYFAADKEMYLASAVQGATLVCFLLLQLMVLWPIWKT